MADMLLISTIVRPSAIEGVGLFTLERLRPGKVVWAWDDRFDRIVRKDDAAKLAPAAIEFLDKYATLRPIGYCVCCDNARFINHSEMPNLAYNAFGQVIALRDIQVGEELTENYVVLGEVPSVGALDDTGIFSARR
jgi:SET domain-containing protein